jgi:PST family polysaccharide transporter
MGADFYPRLTAVAFDHPKCNQLVNEQAEVGLLLAGPGILGTLAFAPLAIFLFYRADFAPAADILRWLCLGMILRVVTWPMGFIIVARGERKIFLWTEVLANAGYAGFVWLGLRMFGLNGTGIAFFALNVLHYSVVYFVVRRLTGFRWSSAARKLALVFIPLVAAIFAAGCFLSPIQSAIVGLVLLVPAGLYSVKTLCALVPMDRLPGVAQKVIRLLRLEPSSGND